MERSEFIETPGWKLKPITMLCTAIRADGERCLQFRYHDYTRPRLRFCWVHLQQYKRREDTKKGATADTSRS